ncbi:MAG: adenylosuccinate lyase, partial [Chloroflexi bacterium]|nr:adenylosuccinate lyase [Chloroflexota bacterium]
MDHNKYQSPYTWRYGSEEIRQIWSEENKRLFWRKLWVALAEAQQEFGLVSKEQVKDLSDHAAQIDIPRALEIESEIHHDLVAELKTFAEQSTIGGGIIHLGATSMDIVDNADALRIKQSLEFILEGIKDLLSLLTNLIEEHANLQVMGHTHIQPAEPTTLGYRFAQYAQDIFLDYNNILQLHETLKGKGFKGAVGSGAAFSDLIGKDNLDKFEQILSDKIGLNFFNITTQTYPRKQDYQISSAIAGLGASLHKMAFDIRILQSPPFGEISEEFSKNQVGSSAMPFKRNPINAEKINSLSRLLAQMPRVAWDNAANSLLE